MMCVLSFSWSCIPVYCVISSRSSSRSNVNVLSSRGKALGLRFGGFPGLISLEASVAIEIGERYDEGNALATCLVMPGVVVQRFHTYIFTWPAHSGKSFGYCVRHHCLDALILVRRG